MVPHNKGKFRSHEQVAQGLCDRMKIDQASSCWIWTGGHGGHGGRYGVCGLNRKSVFVHRFAYEYCRGPIPEGLTIDHVKARGCQSPLCFNPDHLEIVTRIENVMRGDGACVKNARKTHCKSGHLLSGANLRIRTGGGRECKECRRITRIEKREVTNAAARINYARRQEQGKQR